MNRVTVPLLAALDALIAALIGLGVCVVPIFVLWVAQYGMSGGPGVVAGAAADVWLLGHGVDLTVSLPAALTAQLGLPSDLGAFPITIAAAGFSLATFLFGARIGGRSLRAGAALVAAAAATVVTLLVGLGVTTVAARVASAGGHAVVAAGWQGVVLPALVMLAGVGAGAAVERASGTASAFSAAGANAARATGTGASRGAGASPASGGRSDAAGPRAGTLTIPLPSLATLPIRGLTRRYRELDARLRDGIAAALRGGTAAAMLLVAASALVFTVALATHFGRVIGLYESLQAGVLGGAILTLVQAAFLPNAVVWTAAWLTGPGFALGTGSSVGPAGTELGPIPALPILGALPHGSMLFGFVGLLVPLAAGVGAGLLVRRRTRMPAGGHRGALWAAGTAVGIGVVAGVALGIAVWWTSGAAGPGRLVQVGGDPLTVGGAAALEIAVGAAIGLMALRSSEHR